MGFKENLLQKIEIDRAILEVIRSMGPPGSGRRIERDTMRRLLEMGGYRHEQRRDLDLFFIEEPGEEPGLILVLDNDLPIYRTSADDVVLRKSPIVKEMISIRNAIRILNDADVVVSKKEESARSIQKRLIDGLDLSFTEDDIARIALDGKASLDAAYTEGVVESLALFGELLDFQPAPKPMRMSNHHVVGPIQDKTGGEVLFGPVVIYGLVHNVLRLIDVQVNPRDKDRVEMVHQVALGNEPPTMEGHPVFDFLKTAVLDRKLGGDRVS